MRQDTSDDRIPAIRSARRPLFLALSLLGFGITPGGFCATTLPVGKCGDIAGKGGDTLRVAINKAASGDTVDMGALPVTCSTITLSGGEIAIPQQSLTIRGPIDRTVTVTAGNASRVLDHTGTGNLSLHYFEVAYGNAAGSGGCIYSAGATQLDHMTASLCHASQAGGAVAADAVTLFYSLVSGSSAGVAGGGFAAFSNAQSQVEHSTVTGNTAAIGGGIYSAGTVSSSSSSITLNQADSGGGVFAKFAGFDYSLLSQNVANSGGGGAYTAYAAVFSSLVSGNHADFGGGLAVTGRTNVRSSTLSGNSATHRGGGMYVKSSTGASTTVYNSTISGNTASNGGGGYVISAGPTIGSGQVALFNSTVAFNHSETGSGGIWVASPNIVLYSSILSNNSPQDFDASPIIAHTTTAYDSLIVTADEVPPGTLRSDPRLTPLALHGGTLPTHALSSGSPAINHGSNPKNFDFDERGAGYARTVTVTDIGAYEKQVDDDELFYGGFD